MSLWLNPWKGIMTEQDWLTSNNPAEMGEFLLGRSGATYTGPGGLTPAKRISDRKMRLFCSAAASLGGSSLATESWIKWSNAPKEDWEHPWSISHWTTFNTLQGWNHWMQRDEYNNEYLRANILRDLVGNPFQNKPMRWFSVDRSQAWLRWGNGPNVEITQTISDIALAAYSVTKDDYTLDNDRLLVLSDSLEESGCVDPVVLNHLRGKVPCPNTADGKNPIGGYICAGDCSKCKGRQWIPGPNVHYRGCWVLDLILGYD